MNTMESNRQNNCARFAAANGWKVAGRDFTRDLLISGQPHSGGRRNYDYSRPVTDHPEFFKVGRHPVAIVGHNYHDGAMKALPEVLDGRLVIHIPPAGKDASWYYPGGTLPMCLTRPDITKIVWPTDEEMSAMSAAYAEESKRRTAEYAEKARRIASRAAIH